MDNPKRPNPRLALLRTIGLDLAAPLLIFSGARAAGLSVLAAGSIGLVLPVVYLTWQLVRRRRLGQLEVFTSVVLLAVLVGTLFVHDPRLVLAKDGITTAVSGFGVLATLLGHRPLYFTVARPFGEDPGEDWNQHWATRPRFVRLMRTVTSVWGAALLADAVLRFVIAFTLPTTVVPLLGTLQYTVLVAGLALFTVAYTRRNGSAAPVIH